MFPVSNRGDEHFQSGSVPCCCYSMLEFLHSFDHSGPTGLSLTPSFSICFIVPVPGCEMVKYDSTFRVGSLYKNYDSSITQHRIFENL